MAKVFFRSEELSFPFPSLLSVYVSNALGIEAASFFCGGGDVAKKDIAESPTAEPERPNKSTVNSAIWIFLRKFIDLTLRCSEFSLIVFPLDSSGKVCSRCFL